MIAVTYRTYKGDLYVTQVYEPLLVDFVNSLLSNDCEIQKVDRA